ncbi:MAG: signal peptidase II [Chloroflexi bacterium]|nr:signal peptidase II [Chloroflexota bacterium]
MTSASPAPDRETAPIRAIHRLPRFLAVAALVIAFDQATKEVVRANLSVGEAWPQGWELIRITHVHNTGAAFGILQGAGDFLIVTALIAIGALTLFLLSLPAHSRYYPIALSLVLGGAIGNLIDRIRLGHVTDFIDPIYYWAFNVADSAIVIGIIAMGVLSFIAPHEISDAPPEAPTDAMAANAERAR